MPKERLCRSVIRVPLGCFGLGLTVCALEGLWDNVGVVAVVVVVVAVVVVVVVVVAVAEEVSARMGSNYQGPSTSHSHSVTFRVLCGLGFMVGVALW